MFKDHQRHPKVVQVRAKKLSQKTFTCEFNVFFLIDSDNEISKKKSSVGQEDEVMKLSQTEKKQLSDLDSESAIDDMEIIEKPERTDIEKKLE